MCITQRINENGSSMTLKETPKWSLPFKQWQNITETLCNNHTRRVGQFRKENEQKKENKKNAVVRTR